MNCDKSSPTLNLTMAFCHSDNLGIFYVNFPNGFSQDIHAMSHNTFATLHDILDQGSWPLPLRVSHFHHLTPLQRGTPYSKVICNVVWFIKCHRMVKNIDHCFPESEMTSSDVLFCLQPTDIQLTVRKEERNWKISTFEMLKSENLDIFFI